MAEDYTKAGAKYGFYFDQALCTGCKACQISCIDKHDLPLGVMWRHRLSSISSVTPSAVTKKTKSARKIK